VAEHIDMTYYSLSFWRTSMWRQELLNSVGSVLFEIKKLSWARSLIVLEPFCLVTPELLPS